ncbi:hypothetical protein L210DRAFT_237600 [Boletus edulis BED1]|uniref:Secreted protein n=1 Tax=Boletus edulis BED1 TaxID=1328754 RepID=A0AAD4BFY4_BOLED|nr:hypothetical protein L210DRAFT_237600 [Boletus edulis BED1]
MKSMISPGLRTLNRWYVLILLCHASLSLSEPDIPIIHSRVSQPSHRIPSAKRPKLYVVPQAHENLLLKESSAMCTRI